MVHRVPLPLVLPPSVFLSSTSGIYAVLKRRMAQRSANKPNASILDIPIQTEIASFSDTGDAALEQVSSSLASVARAGFSIRQTSLFTRSTRKRLC